MSWLKSTTISIAHLTPPIEQFMFYVVELALSGGWHPQIEEYCRTQIAEWLQANDLNAAMSRISSAEADEFIRDLELLRLLK